jgi:dTDP-4-dehydrorhamnose reductase
MKRVLLVGNNSKIGRRLLKRSTNDLEFYPAGRSGEYITYIDLTKPMTFKFIGSGYDCAVVLAGLNNIKEVEENRELAFAINYKNTVCLIDALNDLGLPCLFISSSCVFAADAITRDELSPRCPSVYYGELKAQVEDHILSTHQMNSVIRLTKIVDDNSIIYSWMKQIRNGLMVNAFDDMLVSPVHIELILPIIYKWCRLCQSRIIHISSDQQITYYEWATMLAHRLNLPTELITVTSVNDFNERPLFMPSDARLECNSTHSKRFWLEETIDKMVNSIWT